MKVAILGSGEVGKTLARGFLGHHHEVMVGTREVSNLAAWQKENPRARVGTFAVAASWCELAVLAVKGSAALEALRIAGAQALAGKVVIDTCNPIADAAPANGVLRFFTTLDDSLMERAQKAFPDVRLVKAFNSVGSARMVDPDFGGVRPTMFICGNDASAKQAAARVLEQFGWESEDMGGVEAARAIEPLCMLWCIPGFLRGQWTHAFKLLK